MHAENIVLQSHLQYVCHVCHVCDIIIGHVMTMKNLQFLSLLLWTLSYIIKISGQLQSRGT